MSNDPADSSSSLEESPVRALDVASLRWRCEPASLGFGSTDDVEPVTGVVGQDDAMEALAFGLEINAPGQNVFVRGLSGTGRLSLVRRLVREVRLQCPLAQDRCYVHNFERPDRPRLITVAHGMGAELRRRMESLITFIHEELPQALKSDAMRRRREALETRAQHELEQITQPFEEELQHAGLALTRVAVGASVQPVLLPLIDGEPVAPEQIETLQRQGRLKEEEIKAIQEKIKLFSKRLAKIGQKAAAVTSRTRESLEELHASEIRRILEPRVTGIKQQIPDEDVKTYLESVVEDVIEQAMRPDDEAAGFTRRYQVNVVLTHGDEGCAVVVENTPTMASLVGTIEAEVRPGEPPRTDHMMIRGGSLLAADGGFLVLEARDLLSEPGAWKALVRTLRTGRLEIGGIDPPGPWLMPSLKPDPIDVNIKVILIGDAEIYYLLDARDPDFPELFKVLADFETVIPRSEEGLGLYAGVLARIVKEEGLLPFDDSAVAALAEHGARIASRQGMLTARFGRLSDIAREAVFLARKESLTRVEGSHVKRAIERTKRRADMPARRFRQLVADGTIRVQVSGHAIGQINGLAVTHAGPLTYGFPARISATIGPGTAGTINIEREAQMSGAIHTKGFYILGGLLRYLLRTDHPLTFDASIAFEQSYGGIDGDSASGAEICCLLSALTDTPLRQDLAMTGAIDQLGNVLPIGAVNEKIEGFYDTCATPPSKEVGGSGEVGEIEPAGLTGTQGVIIPAANVGDLQLREDVVAACAAGRFHVYAVTKIHDALTLFTGIPAGRRVGATNHYSENTLLATALAQARRYWEKAKAIPATRGRKGSESDT